MIDAVVAHLMAQLEVPGEEIFAGKRSTAARLAVLASAMFQFFERAVTALFPFINLTLTPGAIPHYFSSYFTIERIGGRIASARGGVFHIADLARRYQVDVTR